MKNTYIKNDHGQLRNLYWLMLNGISKQSFLPGDFKWTWIYCNESGEMQHAPERRYIRDKVELTIDNFQ